ncbi:ABC transporter ATP-binding protein [Halorubrum ezzemoulense]|uniref:Nickel import system ATP-binding protein NikD n=1 Tax=Halorubrum ezzemoulense TaxID=337243 RepID=A0ABT4Z7M3_HALEZ|nr:ABC transporter ATP-binding protein [Halorubrum ezzemoulense]MDB2294090.1 ABC transporter ATP-binding protein [Halorubrum ezzemoulense]
MSVETKSRRSEQEQLLRVDSLDVKFEVTEGTIHALRNVSLEVGKGEIVGIAGESGSGKSTLALAIVRYLDANGWVDGGSITFQGSDLLSASRTELQSIRGKRIAHVAQNPARALNPSMTIGAQIRETIELHQDIHGGSEATRRVQEVLAQVNLPNPELIADRYPHELSGGQQQRALLAIGLSCNPDLLILDEPTTGLDVTTQAKFLDLVSNLKSEYDAGILLITHNLGVISDIADRVNILYAGEMLESGPVDEVFASPANPYTQALLATTPEIGSDKQVKPIPGRIPELDSIPDGCIFAERCEFATEECHTTDVGMETVDAVGDHRSRCLHWEDVVDNPIDVPRESSTDRTPGDPILRINDLSKYYDEGNFLKNLVTDHKPVKAVDDVSLDICEGEAVGLVGESGCGKSTLGRTLLKLHEVTNGNIQYNNTKIDSLSKRELNEFRSECQMIFQDPEASLNPNRTVREILERPLKLFTDRSSSGRQERTVELLEQVNLGTDIIDKKPHELSGGQQQRIAIGRAFAANPSLIVLDEPVSSLDVSVQASILNLLEELCEEYNTSYLLISHDLSVIESICDRVAVMYLGEIIETGATSQIFEPPHHPYTRALLSSVPTLDPNDEKARIHLEGDVPAARDPPSGCSFHTRCPQKIGEVCETNDPELKESEDGHCISCHLSDEEMSSPSDTGLDPS